MIVGAQFFTIREHCKDLESFAQSLKKVADIGYTTVQISGTCEFEPEWLARQLKANGLKCVITHTPVPKLTGDAAQVCRDHKVFDCKHIGLGYYNFAEGEIGETYQKFVDTFAPVGRAIAENGGYFMYHNHNSEFRHIGGETVLRRLARDIPAEHMGFTLDTYWIQMGGADPAEYITEFAGRVPCIHLKDFAYDRSMAVVGEGNINFDRVLAAAQSAGSEYLLVEQDDCNGEDPFECLKRSYQNLRAMGLT